MAVRGDRDKTEMAKDVGEVDADIIGARGFIRDIRAGFLEKHWLGKSEIAFPVPGRA